MWGDIRGGMKTSCESDHVDYIFAGRASELIHLNLNGKMKRMRQLNYLGWLVLGIACLQSDAVFAVETAPRTKESQAALTPARVLEKLEGGNGRFVQNMRRDRDYLRDVNVTAKGQYPIAAVVGCMDSRVPLALIFDQGVGDLFALGVAGNVVNADIVGSLEYACKVAGAKVILVLGHTECGAVKGAIDHVELGSLTGLLEKIEPSLERVPASMQPRTIKNKAFVDAVAQANVLQMKEEIRAQSAILRDLEKQGAIKIVGGMYDVASGRVTFL